MCCNLFLNNSNSRVHIPACNKKLVFNYTFNNVFVRDYNVISTVSKKSLEFKSNFLRRKKWNVWRFRKIRLLRKVSISPLAVTLIHRKKMSESIESILRKCCYISFEKEKIINSSFFLLTIYLQIILLQIKESKKF